MAYLETKAIGKTYPGVVALDRVDMSFELGRVHVLAGENGAGKSTLIKILTGALQPTEGSVLIDGQNALRDRALFDFVAYVPQELNLFPHMTVAENLFMPFAKSGMPGWTISRSAILRRARECLARFDINVDPNQVTRTLSVSDQQVLQIARAAATTGFKILILDEPTSSLTSSETERLFKIVQDLKASGHGIVFVSHKMDEMFAIGDDVTVLRNGQLVASRRMEDVSAQDIIRLMSGEHIALDETFQPTSAPGEVLLRVDRLGGRGFRDVSFVLKRGEVLGFAGLVGAGRSELMQTLFGFSRRETGAATMGGQPWVFNHPPTSARRGMMYLSEERKIHGILPSLSLADNIGVAVMDQIAPNGVIATRRERNLVRGVIQRYAIKTSSPAKKISLLSGGNQQKAILGRSIARQPKILIVDEPTKGIDIKTKSEIYGLLRELAESGMGIIVVSSEMTELKRCATRIITMYHGAVTGDFPGSADPKTLVSAIIGQLGAGTHHDIA